MMFTQPLSAASTVVTFFDGDATIEIKTDFLVSSRQTNRDIVRKRFFVSSETVKFFLGVANPSSSRYPPDGKGDEKLSVSKLTTKNYAAAFVTTHTTVNGQRHEDHPPRRHYFLLLTSDLGDGNEQNGLCVGEEIAVLFGKPIDKGHRYINLQ